VPTRRLRAAVPGRRGSAARGGDASGTGDERALSGEVEVAADGYGDIYSGITWWRKRGFWAWGTWKSSSPLGQIGGLRTHATSAIS
jgi:hypothetical protein